MEVMFKQFPGCKTQSTAQSFLMRKCLSFSALFFIPLLFLCCLSRNFTVKGSMYFLKNLVLQKQNCVIKCKTLTEQPLCFSTARLARILCLWLSYALGIHRSTSHDKLHHFSGSSFCITTLRDGRFSHVHLTYSKRQGK